LAVAAASQAFLWDVELMAANAEAYNEPTSAIVAQARLIRDTIVQHVNERRGADTAAGSAAEGHSQAEVDAPTDAPAETRARVKRRRL